MHFQDEREPSNPLAVQVLKILQAGRYTAESGKSVDISAAQAEAESTTVLYTPEQLAELQLPDRPASESNVEVVDMTTQVSAHTLAANGSVTLLNFASARNPGGGFLGGAKAQEEDICRCSGLYPTLLTQATYYEVHRKQRSLLYTDHAIYSPRVPFFRVSAKAALLDQPFFPSVITAPAPNAGAIAKNRPDEAEALPQVFTKRWRNVLTIAADQGAEQLVLGAWGCGAFRNDPELVASTLASVLPAMAGYFKRVVLAIPDSSKVGSRNHAVFREHFC